MSTALAQIQKEIAALEKRLNLLRTAETALESLGGKISPNQGDGNLLEPNHAKGIAPTIRDLLRENGPMSKESIDAGLSGRFKLGKGTVSSALQAMKARGAITRSKTGKWTLK